MAITIEARVRAVIVAELSVQDAVITPTATLAADLGADSLDSYELVSALELEFGIEIPDRDLPGLQTVQQLVTYVEGKRVGYGHGV